MDCESDKKDIEVSPHTRKRGGQRKPLPESLPRERLAFDISVKEKFCKIHKVDLVRIWENISEKIELIPAKVKFFQHVTFS